MGFLNDIDFTGVSAQMGGFRLVPNGEYEAVAVAAEIATSKKGSRYLDVRFAIQQGEWAGCEVRHNFNLWHPNETARNIAKSEFKLLCECLGKDPQTLQAPEELCNRPLVVTAEAETYTKTDGTEGKGDRIRAFSAPRRAPKPNYARTAPENTECPF